MVTLGGAPGADGVTWRVTLNGTNYTYTKAAGNTLDDILTGLRNLIPNTYTVAADLTANTLTIRSTGLNTVAVTPPTGGTMTISPDYYVTTITIPATVKVGETWHITLNGTTYDAPVTADNDALALAFKTAMGAAATVLNNVITYTSTLTPSPSFTADPAPVGTYTALVTDGAPATPRSRTPPPTAGANVAVNDVWRVYLNGTPITYTVGTAITGYVGSLFTLDAVALGLAKAIDSNANYIASATGTVITLTKTDDSLIPILPLEQDRAVANTLPASTTQSTSIVHYSNAAIALTPPAQFKKDTAWHITINGIEYTYTSLDSDTNIAAIATGLVGVINGTSGTLLTATANVDVSGAALNGSIRIQDDAGGVYNTFILRRLAAVARFIPSSISITRTWWVASSITTMDSTPRPSITSIECTSSSWIPMAIL